MKINAETLAKIDAIVKEGIPKIDYEAFIPQSEKSAVNAAALDHWEGLVEMRPAYLDALSDGYEIEGYLNGNGVNLKKIMDASEDVNFDSGILVWAEEVNSNVAFSTFAQLREGYFRAIIMDFARAWEDLYRESVRKVTGEDHMGTGNGLTWWDEEQY